MPPGAEDSLPPPPPDGRWNSQRSQHVPTVVADPSPGEARRFDSDAQGVRTTRVDTDGLLVTDDDGLLLDFLATLVATEYILYTSPGLRVPNSPNRLWAMVIPLPRRR
jgi:hypothetical protein